jgi:hypothetical protein
VGRQQDGQNLDPGAALKKTGSNMKKLLFNANANYLSETTDLSNNQINFPVTHG